MNGLDFFGALQAKGIDLPIRIFLDKPVSNFYRPEKLSFCDLSISEDEEISPESLYFLCGKYVHILHSEPTARFRELTKVLLSVEPSVLIVRAGNVFRSWSRGLGWK